MKTRLWGIVLAGGDGTRLASLTRALYGADVPKQFAVLNGDRSLLQATLDRIGPIVDRTRTVVVVRRGHEALAREQLRLYPGVELIVQPRNLDTGPAILIALAHIARRDRRARVAVFPSDHHVGRPAPFVETVDRMSRGRGRVTLLGVVADRPEEEYGWIVAGRPLRRGARAVRRFVEKPDGPLARRLLAAGALWNSFVAAGSLEAWEGLARRHLPSHHEALASDDVEAAYQRLPAASFSRDVFAHDGDLAVTSLDECDWSDMGTPARVFRSLAGTTAFNHLVSRIAAPATA